MAGKSKMKGWGGARNGAGRPIKEMSSRQLSKALKTAKQMAKKHGYDLDEFMLAIVYIDKDIIPGAESIKLPFRAQIAENYLARIMSKGTDEDTDNEFDSPAICLPSQKLDPAKIIPIDEGRKKKSIGDVKGLLDKPKKKGSRPKKKPEETAKV